MCGVRCRAGEFQQNSQRTQNKGVLQSLVILTCALSKKTGTDATWGGPRRRGVLAGVFLENVGEDNLKPALQSGSSKPLAEW